MQSRMEARRAAELSAIFDIWPMLEAPEFEGALEAAFEAGREAGESESYSQGLDMGRAEAAEMAQEMADKLARRIANKSPGLASPADIGAAAARFEGEEYRPPAECPKCEICAMAGIRKPINAEAGGICDECLPGAIYSAEERGEA